MLRDDAIRAGITKPTFEDMERMGLVEKSKAEKEKAEKKKAATGRNRRIKPDKR